MSMPSRSNFIRLADVGGVNDAGPLGRAHGIPDLARLLLYGAILLAGTVSLPQNFSVTGATTALGAASVAICGAAWVLWLARPRVSTAHLSVVLPLLLFAVLATGSVLWSPVTVKGLQLLCVLLEFVGLVVLATRAVEDDPLVAPR